jgi:hypothetical protein
MLCVVLWFTRGAQSLYPSIMGNVNHTPAHFPFRQRFTVSVWAEITYHYEIGLDVIQDPLSGEDYADLFKGTLPLLPYDVPLHVRDNTCFPQEVSLPLCRSLDNNSLVRLIGNGGPIVWLIRSPDLSRSDPLPHRYLYEGMIEGKVVCHEFRDRDNLINCI